MIKRVFQDSEGYLCGEADDPSDFDDTIMSIQRIGYIEPGVGVHTVQIRDRVTGKLIFEAKKYFRIPLKMK